MMSGLFVLLLATLLGVIHASDMPAPFYRALYVTNPYLKGDDVTIAQSLLKRDEAVDQNLVVDGVYGEESAKATASFQAAHSLPNTGVLDSDSAQLLLDLHSKDNYKDSGFTAASMGYLYKFHIPVYTNRSVETYATLYDKDNTVLLKFKVRAHGHRDDGSAGPWPDYGVGDIGYTEYGSNGNTVTGLVEMDLNSPEPDPASYGPWPVNRFVHGLDGNAGFLVPNIRDGLLLHTGNWTTSEVDWKPTKAMPDSSGCVHAHPSDVERIYQILTGLGVEVRENPFSGKNYPYKPQGIAVVEQLD